MDRNADPLALAPKGRRFFVGDNGADMNVVLNGKETELGEGMSILEMLAQREIPPESVVVERNRDIVPAERFGETLLEDGDQLEVLRFVGGG